MAFGWCANLAGADNYFATERLVTVCWDNLESSADVKKKAALIMAYNRLYYGGEFTLPTYAAATAAQLIVLVKANCEMACYLSRHLSDEDRRKGLQVQGVLAPGRIPAGRFPSPLCIRDVHDRPASKRHSSP